MKTKVMNNEGVTLIALVITIIVLIILAGVSISALTGEKGMIGQAKAAKDKTRAATIEEARDLWETKNEGEDEPISLSDLLDDLILKKILNNEEKNEILNSNQHKITIAKKDKFFVEKSITINK